MSIQEVELCSGTPGMLCRWGKSEETREKGLLLFRVAILEVLEDRSCVDEESRSFSHKLFELLGSGDGSKLFLEVKLDVGTGLVGAPACGDVMKLQIRVDPETNKISDVKFKTFGCGSAIASSSYLTELVRGMSLDEAGKVKNTEIAKELCLPPVKRMYPVAI